ncbi:hypothetical protein Tco_1249374, partial [Tanacetum coccineum]
IVDSEPIEDDSEEDLKMDHVDYPSDEEEEEEPLAPTDPTSPVPDYVPSSEEIEPFETYKYAATPPLPVSPHIVVPLSRTGLYRARKTVQPQPPLLASTKARTAEYAVASTPPSLPPSPLSPLLSPSPRIPSPPLLT